MHSCVLIVSKSTKKISSPMFSMNSKRAAREAETQNKLKYGKRHAAEDESQCKAILCQAGCWTATIWNMPKLRKDMPGVKHMPADSGPVVVMLGSAMTWPCVSCHACKSWQLICTVIFWFLFNFKSFLSSVFCQICHKVVIAETEFFLNGLNWLNLAQVVTSWNVKAWLL